MQYEGAVYRPPSEARSLIIQVTIGCTHNKCTFCTMFKDKHFRMRHMDEIFKDLDEMSNYYGHLPLRIFLADADALCLKTEYLLTILDYIHQKFPRAERVTIYGRASEVVRKSVDELKLLKDHGLWMIYMGGESGNDEILQAVCKGEDRAMFIEAAKRLKASGIKLSLTFISGLGGKERLKEHALDCASLTTIMKPEYVGFLTLMLEPSAPIMKDINEGRMTLLTPEDVLSEMRLYLENVDSAGSVFRSNHASNYIVLKGTLNQDIPKMLDYLNRVEAEHFYRPEYLRGL